MQAALAVYLSIGFGVLCMFVFDLIRKKLVGRKEICPVCNFPNPPGTTECKNPDKVLVNGRWKLVCNASIPLSLEHGQLPDTHDSLRLPVRPNYIGNIVILIVSSIGFYILLL
jgi:hypothetical protein